MTGHALHGRRSGRVGNLRAALRPTQHPARTVFVVALTLRWLTALVMGALRLSPNPDEHLYIRLAADLAAARTDQWWDYAEAAYADGALFVHLLALVDALPLPPLLGGRLVVGVLGAMTAAVAARVAATWVSPRAGLVAGLLVALWPSQIIFSASAIRDALIWLLLATVALAVLAGMDAARWRVAGWGTVAIACVGSLYLLRPSTAVVAGGALFVAVAWSWRRGRGRMLAVVALALVVLPWASGLGVAAVDVFSLESVNDLQQDRAAASSAAACTDLGRLAPATSMSGAITRIVRAGPASLLGPYPWADVCSAWGTAAKVESALFAALLVAGGMGVVARRDQLRRVSFALALVAGLTLVFALGEDNVGTAFRHRGQLHWAVAVFVAGLVVPRGEQAVGIGDPPPDSLAASRGQARRTASAG